MTTTAYGFKVEVTDHTPGLDLPQRLGRRLWAPMWVMSVMAFAAALVAAGVRAGSIASGAAETTVQAQAHLGTGLMFTGFAAVFAAISFAIARILGQLRTRGGEVQEAVGGQVETLEMPTTVRVFVIGMAAAMMTLVVAVVIHLATAAGTASGAVGLEASETTMIVLEGVRRFAVALYLASIAFGLATITKVLRFQAIRIRRLG